MAGLAYAENRVYSSYAPEISEDSRLADGVLTYRNIYTGKTQDIEEVVLFTYATPRAPDFILHTALQKMRVPLHIIGDAHAPCTTLGATSQGHRLGNLL